MGVVGAGVASIPQQPIATNCSRSSSNNNGSRHCKCAVCCTVLHCDVVCCSVMQCAAVSCSALQSVAVCCSVLQCVVVCGSVLQCVAVCCHMVFHNSISVCCIALCCSVLQCATVCRCTFQHSRSCIEVCCNVLRCEALYAHTPARIPSMCLYVWRCVVQGGEDS